MRYIELRVSRNYESLSVELESQDDLAAAYKDAKAMLAELQAQKEAVEPKTTEMKLYDNASATDPEDPDTQPPDADYGLCPKCRAPMAHRAGAINGQYEEFIACTRCPFIDFPLSRKLGLISRGH